MTPYPGIAQLVVATSGAAPGIIVTSGSGDAHGWWPTPLIVQGNDARNAANLNAAVESLTDRSNWIGWRAIDWIAGGDYRSLFGGQVMIANSVIIDRSGTSDLIAALVVKGTTGSTVLAADISGSGTSGRAARFTGASSADVAVLIVGGSTTGDGLHVTAQAGNSTAIIGTGHGSGSGVVANAGGTAGTPSVRAQSGPVLVDTNLGSPGTAPGANMLWAEGIIKARGNLVVTTGPSAVAISAGSFNVSAAVFAEPSAGHFLAITVTMPQAMASGTDYEVHMAAIRLGADFYQPVAVIVDATHWKVYVPTTYGAGFTPGQIDNQAAVYPFVVLGNQ